MLILEGSGGILPRKEKFEIYVEIESQGILESIYLAIKHVAINLSN